MQYLNKYDTKKTLKNFYVNHFKKSNFMKKFNLEGQLELIKRGNHEEIMYYLRLRYLSKEALPLLIKRANAEEILAYIAKRFD